jgi:hypothetical protein
MIDPLDNATQALPDVEPRWMALLKAAIASTEGRGGVSKAASAMGVSRPYVARVLMTGENRIKVPSQAFIKRVIAAFGQGRVDCPHLAHDISLSECQSFACREWKVIHGSGPEKVLHWRACQSCPQNPVKAKP